MNQIVISNCLADACPPIDWPSVPQITADAIYYSESKFHSFFREFLPRALLSEPNLLRFDHRDPRDKLLFFSAGKDKKKVVDPKNVHKLLKRFNKDFDVKFVPSTDASQLCAEITEAAKVGKLTNVVIDAHGEPDAININQEDASNFYQYYFGDRGFVRNQNFETCFSGLKPYGKITLLSCKSGSANYFINWGDIQLGKMRNIAQSLADESKRLVLGAPHNILGLPDFSPAVEESEMISYFTVSDNLLWKYALQPFRPIYNDCIFNTNLVEIEVIANNLISKNLIKRGLINHNQPFDTLSTVKVCKSDPRSTFIYFVSGSPYRWPFDQFKHYNWSFYELKQFLPQFINSFMQSPQHPAGVSNILKSLADTYQLFYNRAYSVRRLCEKVEKVSQISSIAGIAIQTYSEHPYFALSEGSPHMLNRISAAELTQIGHCLQKVSKKGTIFLIGGKANRLVAQPNSTNIFSDLWNRITTPFRPSIAQALANLSKRKVTFIDSSITGYNQPIATDPFQSKGKHMRDYYPSV